MSTPAPTLPEQNSATPITAQVTASPAGPPVDPLHQAVAAIITPLAGPLVATLAAAVKQDVASVQSDVAQAQGQIQSLQTAAESHGGALGELKSLADTHSAQINAIEQELGAAVQANAKEIVLILVVGSVVGILALWIAYLAGSHTAADAWAAIPGGAAALAAALGVYFRNTTVGATP